MSLYHHFDFNMTLAVIICFINKLRETVPHSRPSSYYHAALSQSPAECQTPPKWVTRQNIHLEADVVATLPHALAYPLRLNLRSPPMARSPPIVQGLMQPPSANNNPSVIIPAAIFGVAGVTVNEILNAEDNNVKAAVVVICNDANDNHGLMKMMTLTTIMILIMTKTSGKEQ